MENFESGQIIDCRKGLAEVIVQHESKLFVELLGKQVRKNRFITLDLETDEDIHLVDHKEAFKNDDKPLIRQR